MTKALALISGGLDSILAARVIKGQGIDVTGICFKSAFFGPENAIRMAEAINIPLIVVDFTDEHIKMTRNPKFGYGKNMNPCIDCHSMMLKFAGAMLEDLGADFLITGEVLNQRPMSQTRQSLDIVKRESGYSDRILRPLCARNLPPTRMETEGLVNRDMLLDIQGKSRKVQMKLAEDLGIHEYPSPAGGCSLTEQNFSRRLRDLYDHEDEFDISDIELLKIGRHFRISGDAKIVATRNAGELEPLRLLVRKDDMIFDTAGYSGSTVLLRGTASEDNISLAASIAARYSKGSQLEAVPVSYRQKDWKQARTIDIIKPAADGDIARFML
jgi:tRNA U34 2-thiouridine synthase MnmA/TrmU